MPKIKLDIDLHHDIINDIKIKDGYDVSLQVVKSVIRSLKACMIKKAITKKYAYLTNFFCIKTVDRKSRQIRNPKTGEVKYRAKCTKLKVVLSKELRGFNL